LAEDTSLFGNEGFRVSSLFSFTVVFDFILSPQVYWLPWDKNEAGNLTDVELASLVTAIGNQEAVAKSELKEVRHYFITVGSEG